MSLPTYLGYPVLHWQPDWQGPTPQTSYRRSKARWDSGIGQVRDDSPYVPAPRTLRTMRYVFGSRAEILDAQDFLLTQAQGRLKPFWLASWTQDMVLLEGAAADADELVIRPMGYQPLLAGDGKGRRHVALWPRNTSGSVVYREITDHSVEAGAERLVLDADIGVALDVRDPVDFLLFCRLDADELTLQWEHMTVATLELPVIDLPWEVP